uniref:LAM_G_DOMAIN domain-containing protein n=1 Tax=Caenorhabditis tropicalis TaxID=1561998 RepID=A0A1I7TV14_9PELO
MEGVWSQSDEGGDFILLFIDEGKLYVGVNLGADVHLKPISTNVTVADNHWHSVAFRRKERKCELWVDSKKILHVVASPGDVNLDSNGLVYLGGANPKKHKLLKSLDLTNKFVGCVKSLKIFGKDINMLVDSLKSIETPKYCHG